MEFVNSNKSWEVAASFSTPPEAHIAKGMLEAEGIPCQIQAPLMATLYGAGSTWAPVELLVPAAYLDRAHTLLDAHHDS